MSASSGRHFFISYSRTDTTQKQNIIKQLRTRGINLWVDIENLVPGSPAWEREIERAIRDAAGIIVLLSPDSNNSEWVRREISFAEQNDKQIFPVLIRGDEDDSVPLRLSSHQWVDLRRNYNNGLDGLADALKDQLGITAVSNGIKVYAIQTAIPDTSLENQESVQEYVVSGETIPPKKAQALNKWFLPAGILIVISILALGSLWAGSQLISQISPSQSSFTATVFTTAMATTTPTAAAIKTQTPANTSLPPTATIPAPDRLSEYLSDVQVLYIDTFDDPLGSGWSVDAGTIENGVMELIGNENWSFSYWNGEFGENEGVVLDFNYSINSLSEIFMGYGIWETDEYKRFGAYIGGDQPKVDEYRGNEDHGGANLSGNLTLQPGTTYSLLIAILPNGEFLEAIWDPSNSSEALFYREKIDETWAGLIWTLWIGVNQNTIQFDNFHEIKFSSAK